MRNICLIGAGGHSKVIKDVLKHKNLSINSYFVDHVSKPHKDNIPIFCSDTINNYLDNDFIIAIGNNKIRYKFSQKYTINYSKLCIDKSAKLSSSATIENGTVIMPKAVINADTKIGYHCIINTAAIIEHDCTIQNFAHISPNATLCGNVSVGEGTHIGAAAVIIPNIKIGKWATIGAGSVILNDVPDFAVVVGNPGKIIRYNKNE